MHSLTAFAFGATVAIAFGPISLLILTTSATDGLSNGLRAAAGAAAADFLFALVAFAGGSGLAATVQSHETSLRLFAAMVLVCFGLWMSIRTIRMTSPATAAQGDVLSAPFLQTLGLTLVNPLTVITFAAFSLQLPIATSVAGVVWFATCLFLGSLSIQVALSLVGAVMHGLAAVRAAWLSFANVISGLGIASFGAYGLLDANAACC